MSGLEYNPKLNVERVQKIRDVLEVSGSYDQSIHKHSCGTPACVAGHTYCVAKGVAVIDESVSIEEIDNVATEYLGLSIGQSVELFWAVNNDDQEDPTNSDIVEVLDNLIENYVVDWGVAGF